MLRVRAIFAVLLSVGLFPVSPTVGQDWVVRILGPAPGDLGPRIDAIFQREMLDIARSSARLEDGSPAIYNHPSMLCFTREGTPVFMWNGGRAEGENSNRIFYSRLQEGAQAWPEPRRLESTQIDFGTIYQPQKEDAPLIAGYWLGPPGRSGAAL